MFAYSRVCACVESRPFWGVLPVWTSPDRRTVRTNVIYFGVLFRSRDLWWEDDTTGDSFWGDKFGAFTACKFGECLT